MAELERVVRETIDDFLRNISSGFWRRLKEPMTWSEEIGNEEIQFEVEVLEKGSSQFNVGVIVQDPNGLLLSGNFFVVCDCPSR